MPPRTTTWPLDPHTAAKHELLRKYLGAWFPILTARGYNRRVIFLDGFAGPGIYRDGEPGSPIVALSTLINHPTFSKLDATEFVFFFIEENAARAESLAEEIERFWDGVKGGQPENVRVEVIPSTFEEVAAGLLDNLEKSGGNLAPTLAFVDPFGYSGASIDTICRLTRFDRCEVIFNFMFSWLTRGATHPDEAVRQNLVDLFGNRDFERAGGMEPPERKRFLHDLYEQQLRDRGGFQFILDFEMVDIRGKSYSLFFGTRHMKGLEAMKRAMWSIDPSGAFRFSDRKAGLTPLFGEQINIAPLRAAISKEFSGRRATIEQIHDFVMTETIYGPDHYRRNVLAKMEKEEKSLHVISSTRKIANGYPPGTILAFD